MLRDHPHARADDAGQLKDSNGRCEVAALSGGFSGCRELATGADVAIELPTGAGETLVGLLLAECRRRANSERVAYLCPNVQLARQAAVRAADYGIDALRSLGDRRTSVID